MSKVIKVTPVNIIKPQTEPAKLQEIIEVSPDIITLNNIPPAVDVEPDVVNMIITSPIEMMLRLIDCQIPIDNYELFLATIREVLVRFDTDPKKYKKEDYLKLILAIISCFKHLYNLDISLWSVTEWSGEGSDEKVPTEKLVRASLDAIDSKLTWISNDEEKLGLINFINVVDDYDYYDRSKLLYPQSQIFYQDESLWIIYANGLEYNFNSLPEFLDAKFRILQLEEKISNVLQKDNIDLINNDNGAHLLFEDGALLLVKLDLATKDSNGALSSTDKVKIDSLGWVSF